jgi:hypothetical protein
MSFQERRCIVSIFSTLLIFGVYGLIVARRYQEAILQGEPGLRFWAGAILILIPVMMAAQIIIHIIFAIVHRITTDEDCPSFSDERDKLIELKATRNSHWVFILGFFLAVGSLVIGQPPRVMFILLASFLIVSCVIQELSQLYYYRKGI